MRKIRYKLLRNKLFTSEEILSEVVKAINLKSITPSRPLSILDMMGGTGIVGKYVKNLLELRNFKVNLTVADIDKSILEQIKNKDIKKVVGDICNIKLKDNLYEYIFIRFSFHEIAKENKEKALKQCYKILKIKGKLVIVDLLPTKETREAVNETDTLKNLLEGRPNKSYFSTKEEFSYLLHKTGFKYVKLFKKLQQKISTEIWYQTQQIDKQGLEKLNQKLLSLPYRIKKVFKIKKEGNYVIADIPIGIITGDK